MNNTPNNLLSDYEDPGILYQDKALIAVSKPAGWHVCPGRTCSESVWDWLLRKFPEIEFIGDTTGKAFAHRLDRDTSGVLLAARDQQSFEATRRYFRDHLVRKEYLALAEGVISSLLQIDLRLGGRHRHSRRVSIVLKQNRFHWTRAAQTEVRPIVHTDEFTYCAVQISTGVRHQIRAHLGHTGHPIAGDNLYGATCLLPELKNRFFLHAHRITLPHPVSKKPLEIECPLPRSLRAVLSGLGILPPEKQPPNAP
jgi:23S rRNA pseudouridine1911/1915/1917 synthase